MHKAVILVKGFAAKCMEDRINAYSAQIAFFIMMSVIPFLMVFSSLLKYTSITESAFLEIVEGVLPEYVSPFLTSLIREIYSNSMGTISLAAIFAVWSSAKGIQYMADGLNFVHGLRETRNWLILRVWAVVYTVLFMIAIVFTLVVLVFGNGLRELAVEHIRFLEPVVRVLVPFHGLLTLFLLIFFFDLLFTALPNKRLSLRSQLPGAAACALAWYVFSFGLSVYVDYFNGFSMYGSLTTVVLIMLWLYFCMFIMMASAELNVWLYRRKNRIG